jgi:long-chain acyl-CoA synthetase
MHPLAQTVSQCLDDVLETEPDRVAVIDDAASLTYAEVDAAANDAAAALAQRGVRSGDRVAVCLPNGIDIVVAFHATMRLGAIWVGVNRALAAVEKGNLLSLTQPRVFLTEPAATAGWERDWPTIVTGSVRASDSWREEVASCAGASRPGLPDPDAPAAIAFTSGTTGLPKGIVHSQRNLLLPAASIGLSRRYDSTLRKGDCLPLTILNLQVLTTLLTSAVGGCSVLTDRRDARGVSQWIARQRVTVWNGVPAQLYTLVHDPEIEAPLLSSLQEAWTGGAACPPELIDAFSSKFGVPLRQTYGQTEAPTVITMDPASEPPVKGSSGKALPHLHVWTADDQGSQLPTGGTGEICVSAIDEGPWAGTYTPMLGLWRDRRLQRGTDTLLRTGDLGFVDADGRLFVLERKDTLIIRGGANVYPAEVERVLDSLPGVRSSVVLGLPDDRMGQRVVAFVEPQPGSEIDGDWLRGQCASLLARYKVPEQIEVIDRLPRNEMGKVQRALLRDLLDHRDTEAL